MEEIKDSVKVVYTGPWRKVELLKIEIISYEEAVKRYGKFDEKKARAVQYL